MIHLLFLSIDPLFTALEDEYWWLQFQQKEIGTILLLISGANSRI